MGLTLTVLGFVVCLIGIAIHACCVISVVRVLFY